MYYRPNVFFKQFRVKGGADRVMVYLYLFINACLKELHNVSNYKDHIVQNI